MKKKRFYLFAVGVDENGEWVELPGRHHELALAIYASKREGTSRQCNIRIRRIGSGGQDDAIVFLWHAGQDGEADLPWCPSCGNPLEHVICFVCCESQAVTTL